MSSDRVLYGMLTVAGLGVIGAGGWMHYQNEPLLPPAPPVERRPEANESGTSLANTLAGYKVILQEDSKHFGVGVNLSALMQPFPYHLEFEGSHRLIGKDSLSTEHLEIEARIEKQWTNMGGNQGFGTDQFLLTIKNKSSKHVAYRVDTEVPDLRVCRSKGPVPHNAIALRPNEEITRSECLWSRGFSAIIRRVEVMEIPSLSYYYLSRLHPPHVLLEERTAEGHQPPIGKPCEMVPWREIQSGAEAGDISWADLMDFYGRHNCDEYSFFRGYRRRTKPDAPLPALAPAQASAGERPR
jgi:hypothetical protein